MKRIIQILFVLGLFAMPIQANDSTLSATPLLPNTPFFRIPVRTLIIPLPESKRVIKTEKSDVVKKKHHLKKSWDGFEFGIFA